jgi:ABC-2 type transport system permease protein
MSKDNTDNTEGVERRPSAFGAGWLLARLFFRINLGRRRSWWLLAALSLPLGLTFWWRCTDGGSGLAFFLELSVNMLLQLYALGLCLYLGVAAVRDEIEDRTIVYLLARPVPLWAILAGKFGAVATAVALGLGATACLVYLVAVSADGGAALGFGLGHLGLALAALGLACLVYTCLFGLIGVLLRRPMIPALVLAFGWEGIASNLPGGFPRASLMFYIKSLMGLGPEADGVLGVLLPPVAPAEPGTAIAVILGATLIFLIAALLVGSRKEVAV